MTLGVWHERDSGIAGGGGGDFGDFSQTRALKVIKSEERRPILVSKCGAPSQTRYFRNPGGGGGKKNSFDPRFIKTY